MVETIKVLIADDHLHEREGFKVLLSFAKSIQVVDVADSAQSTVQKALQLRPDVVLLDLEWYKDRTAGIAAIKQIKMHAPEIKILAATVYIDLIEPARSAGAELAVDKGSLNNRVALENRIRDAYTTNSFATPQTLLVEALSTREMDALCLIAQGETDEGIATQLIVSVSTVKKHISAILDKLQARNRSEAVAISYEKGLLPRRAADQ